ncbi:pyrroline-5-carboxylate reductase dimerization-domain-containing protein [Aspergillus varians]
MPDQRPRTLCILGCGNLGTAILKSLLDSPNQIFTHYIACVNTQSSLQRLIAQFPHHSANLTIIAEKSIPNNSNIVIARADVTILALDPSSLRGVLVRPGISRALEGKLLISVVAGWTRRKLEETIYGKASPADGDGDGDSELPLKRASIIRTLPNIAAHVSQSLTAIEIDPTCTIPAEYLALTDSIFSTIGKTIHIPPSLIDATTAVAGSTPAMFAVIVDSMIDAAVAVGVPRELAQTMIFQAMQGTATMLQSGVRPAELKEQGTSPEGCTIAGLMVMEERGVRGGVGRALREAVSVARVMDGERHVNDTRGEGVGR